MGEFPWRVGLAAACLLLAKLAAVALPMVLKWIVDSLDTKESQLVGVPLSLLLFYGVLRYGENLPREATSRLQRHIAAQLANLVKMSLRSNRGAFRAEAATFVRRLRRALRRDLAPPADLADPDRDTDRTARRQRSRAKA